MSRDKTHIKVELRREITEALKALGKMGDSYDTVIERLIKHARNCQFVEEER